MVVLSVGLEANVDSNFIANSLGIDIDENNWFVEKDNLLSQTSSTKAGIFIAGACHGPKDIPDTVAQASAAASEVLKSLSKFKSNSKENQIIEEPSITN
jgi:heterodisulfide reductase subunit A